MVVVIFFSHEKHLSSQRKNTKLERWN